MACALLVLSLDRVSSHTNANALLLTMQKVLAELQSPNFLRALQEILADIFRAEAIDGRAVRKNRGRLRVPRRT